MSSRVVKAALVGAVTVAACWRSEAPGVQSAAPPSRHGPPKIINLGPRETDLLDPTLLARMLRTDPRRALSDLGPIVYVDLDRGTIDTLCDDAALRAQEELHVVLADPARQPPSCRVSATTMSCYQLGEAPMVIVNFTTAVPVHPIIIMHGAPGTHSATVSVIKLKDALQNGRCP